MDISEYLSAIGVANPAELKSTTKQGLGSLIWLQQTRPDIGFTITQIATKIVEACECSEKALKVANLYNKIARFAKNRRRKIRYAKFLSANRDSPMGPSMFLNWELFVSADAGFGTLVQNHSSGSHVGAHGDAIEHDGILKCHGSTMAHRCAEIHCVCRPTLSAVAHAAVASVDVSLWFHVFLAEIFTREFNYKRLTHPAEFPSVNPFRESPTDDEVRKEASLEKIRSILVSVREDSPMMANELQTFTTTCKCCNVSMQLAAVTTRDLTPVAQ